MTASLDSYVNSGYELLQNEIPLILNIKDKYNADQKVTVTDEKIAQVKEAVLSSLGKSPYIQERFVDSRVADLIYTACEKEPRVMLSFASTLNSYGAAGYGMMILEFKEASDMKK
ncbi:MAG: hypothetical protein ACI9S8_002221 [Chlamydiales bacterium]|jgi:hypothetical protein